MSTAGSHGGHLAALAALDGMGPVRLRTLLSLAPPAELWEKLGSATCRELAARSNVTHRCGPDRLFEDQRPQCGSLLSDDLVRGWERQARSTRHTPGAMDDRIDALGLNVCTGAELSEPLGSDPDPPAVLFASGSYIEPGRARVAIVGTRKASEYGLRMARSLGRDLAAAGVEVVSGLALGIDAAAHAGALEGSSGPTRVVAVIGAGHDRPCPSRNRALARAVGAAGSIISEVPPGIPSAPWRYPVRNRLIAALVDLVVVVESASKGGSMSTVAEALARDRLVMAVPGPIGRRTSQGCHDLLRDGAEICTGADDVMSSLGLLGYVPVRVGDLGRDVDVDSADRLGSGADPGRDGVGERCPDGGGDAATESLVLDLLAEGPCTIDSLIGRSGLDFTQLCSVVAAMEANSSVSTAAGWVRRTS